MLLDGEDFILVVQSIFLVIILMLIIGVSMYYYEKLNCESKAEKMDVEVNFSFFEGCMLRIDGKWINSVNYRYIEQDEYSGVKKWEIK